MFAIASSRVLAVVATLALTTTILSPSGDAAAAEPEHRATVAPIPSPPQGRPVTVRPTGDFSPLSTVPSPAKNKSVGAKEPAKPSIADDAGAFDEVTSVVLDRTEFADVYRNADGTNTSAISLAPTNVKLSDGTWVDGSSAVRKFSDGSFGVARHALSPSFAANAAVPGAFSAKRGGYDVSFTLQGANDAPILGAASRRSSTNEGKVSYPEVFPGVDLTYEVEPGSVKETLVLAEMPDAGEYTWTWLVDAPGLSLAENEFGDIEFLDKDGEAQFMIPDPYMWDSSGRVGLREPALANVGTSIGGKAGSWSVTLSADETWLSDPKREYPVFVDPTLTTNGANINSYKSDGYHLSGSVYIGNSRDYNTNKYWRAIVHYPYSSLAGKQITGASLAGSLRSGTSVRYEGYVHRATCHGYSCVGEKRSKMIVTTSGSATQSGMGLQLAQWVNSKGYQGSFMLRGGEITAYTYKSLNTTLYVGWKNFPAVTGKIAPSPGNGAVVGITPTFNVYTVRLVCLFPK